METKCPSIQTSSGGRIPTQVITQKGNWQSCFMVITSTAICCAAAVRAGWDGYRRTAKNTTFQLVISCKHTSTQSYWLHCLYLLADLLQNLCEHFGGHPIKRLRGNNKGTGI